MVDKTQKRQRGALHFFIAMLALVALLFGVFVALTGQASAALRVDGIPAASQLKSQQQRQAPNAPNGGTATATATATPTCVPGSPSTWVVTSPIPAAAEGVSTDSDGTYAYLAGGDNGSNAFDQFARYDTATNVWTSLAPMPTAASAVSVVYSPINNKLYAFGGCDCTNVVNVTRVYDISTGTWSSGAVMPSPRYLAGAAYYNGKIYLAGGIDENFTAQAQLWEYDPVLDTWNTSRANMPAERVAPGFGVVNGHLYIIAGGDGSFTQQNTVFDYDIGANTWATRTNIPTGVLGPGSAVVYGRIWVFGGGTPFTHIQTKGAKSTKPAKPTKSLIEPNAAPDALNTTQIYDPATDTWSTGPDLNVSRVILAGTFVGNKVVAAGGTDGSGTFYDTTEANMVSGTCISPTGTPPTNTSTPTGTTTSTPTITPIPTCGLVWHVVDSPNPSSRNPLRDIAVVSANDIWAVGFHGPGRHTLTEHWDGSQWSVVPSPDMGAYTSLSALAVVSANDVWAVGDYENQGVEDNQTFTMHWDGSAWSIIPSPIGPQGYSNFLRGAVAVAANDVWAVGDREANPGSPSQTLILNWDGSAWSIVSSPNPSASNNYLSGVAAISTNDVWAVGDYTANSIDNTLTEHWDGTQWSVVPSPTTGGGTLQGVTVISANDMWAVGNYANNGRLAPLTMHWDGTQWSIVPSPDPGGVGLSFLFGVAAVSPNDVWAVGFYVVTQGTEYTLTMHWDGTAWSIVDSPNPDPSENRLARVAVVSANNVWAAGYYRPFGSEQTLILRYNDPCGTATATVQATDTPLPTLPPPPPTNTPATPTATPACGLAWRVVDSPGAYYLYGVAVVSANDVWAVGLDFSTGAIIMRWDGTQWSVVPNPSPGIHAILFGVVAVSANDVWAVGRNGYQAVASTLTEHWDGSQWSIVPSPNPAPGSQLRSVAAVSANDVWAVGYTILNNQAATLAEHWNGSAWSVVPKLIPG